MILDNLAVRHKTFGCGTVVSTDGKYMTIHFESADKVFVYPDAFEKFLTLADGTVPPQILEDIQTSRNRKMQIQNEKQQENLRAMTHGIVIPGKESVPETKEDDGFQSEIEEI